MMNHFALGDDEFEEQFSACKLNPQIFTHEAHLRLAWIHIHKYGIKDAIDNICCQLQNFVASIGAADKYNATVTVAAIRAVYHFMLRSETNNFISFINENLQLKNNFKELLNYHYTTDIFNSEQARVTYLEPELLPFD